MASSKIARFLTNSILIVYYCLEAMVLSLIPKKFRFKNIEGQCVLVTGGGSGIGRLLAMRFAAKGAKVVVWDLNEEAAEETAKMVRREHNVDSWAFRVDVSKPQHVYDAAALVKRSAGKVDVLVNNAGVVTGKALLDCSDASIQRTFEVNAISHFWTCKAFLPEMLASNSGHLVSIASMAGQSGVVKLTDYCASKFAAVGFEESLRFELHAAGYTGVHSTVICPYFVNTGMFDGAKPGLFAMMTPEYVADQIVAAVLVNQEVLLLPKTFNFLMVLRAIFPSKVVREVLAQTSISSSMHGFDGRHDVKHDILSYDDTKIKGL